MKRKLCLTGGILGVVGNSIISGLFIVCLALAKDFFAIATKYYDSYYGYYYEYYVPTYLYVVLGLLLAVSLIALALSINAIIVWNKNPKSYRKSFAWNIISIIANFMIAIFMIVCLVSASDTVTIILFILFLGLEIASGVIILVDLCLEGRRLRKMGYVEEDIPQQEAGEVVVSVKTTKAQPIKVENKTASMDTLEAKIEKLGSMKEKGLLSEEEYNQLKQNYIKEYLMK